MDRMRWYASLLLSLAIVWITACGAEQELPRDPASSEPSVQESVAVEGESHAPQAPSQWPESDKGANEVASPEGESKPIEAHPSSRTADKEHKVAVDAAVEKEGVSEQPTEVEQAEEVPIPANQVTMSISGESDAEFILGSTMIELEEGDTVLDVLKRETRKQKIPIEYRGGSGALAYLEGINNLYEFDHGPESGWVYYVNGERPNKSAGSYSLEAGDVVEWVYVTKDTDEEEAKEES